MIILGAWLLADFMSGLIHWWQDRVLIHPSRHEFINQIKIDNDMHHDRPAQMISYSIWQNIKTSVIIAWPVSLVLLLSGYPLVIWLAVFFASFGNMIHRFAHLPHARVPRVVKVLQWTGFFISFKHHHDHHFLKHKLLKKEKTTKRYCPMTNWLNPILDGVGFFRLLEKVFL